jgi:hypothetical protein
MSRCEICEAERPERKVRWVDGYLVCVWCRPVSFLESRERVREAAGELAEAVRSALLAALGRT